VIIRSLDFEKRKVPFLSRYLALSADRGTTGHTDWPCQLDFHRRSGVKRADVAGSDDRAGELRVWKSFPVSLSFEMISEAL